MPSARLINWTQASALNHRISAGALVEQNGRVLLVRSRKEGVYDFWVAPGGGIQGTETLAAAAEREVKEETGLLVKTGQLVYVEEFFSPETRFCKFWFAATLAGGTLSVAAPEAAAEFIVDAAWLTHPQIQSLPVFPEVLRERYWQDRAAGFAGGLQHLGLRAMKFW